MTKAWIILVACAMATGCSNSRIVRNNTVAKKFAAFNKGGWSVTGGGVNNGISSSINPNQKLVPVPGGQGVTYRSVSNPLSNPVWNTNFRVDSPNGIHVNSPNNGGPMTVTGPMNQGTINVTDPSNGQPGSVQVR